MTTINSFNNYDNCSWGKKSIFWKLKEVKRRFRIFCRETFIHLKSRKAVPPTKRKPGDFEHVLTVLNGRVLSLGHVADFNEATKKFKDCNNNYEVFWTGWFWFGYDKRYKTRPEAERMALLSAYCVVHPVSSFEIKGNEKEKDYRS